MLGFTNISWCHTVLLPHLQYRFAVLLKLHFYFIVLQSYSFIQLLQTPGSNSLFVCTNVVNKVDSDNMRPIMQSNGKHSILGASSAYLCAQFVWRCWKWVKWVNKREQLFFAHWWVVSTQIAWNCEGMTCSLFISKHEALLYSPGLWWYLNVNFLFQFTCEISLVCFFCSSSAVHFLQRNKPIFSL